MSDSEEATRRLREFVEANSTTVAELSESMKKLTASVLAFTHSFEELTKLLNRKED